MGDYGLPLLRQEHAFIHAMSFPACLWDVAECIPAPIAGFNLFHAGSSALARHAGSVRKRFLVRAIGLLANFCWNPAGFECNPGRPFLRNRMCPLGIVIRKQLRILRGLSKETQRRAV